MASRLLAVLALAASSLSFLAAGQEATPTDCPPFTLPSSLDPVASLPDPFLYLNGSRVETPEGWSCRREEIKSLIQTLELGPKPAPPAVEASLSGNTLTIQCSEGGKSVSFTATIRAPSGGTGPFPVLIALGGSSIPTPQGVATISYNNEGIAATDPRGRGEFYNLYGANHEAGGLMAWAWGVSRIIDALELLGPEVTNIDSTKVAVTGCSRNGKGALISGAFDDRIVLTIPQEGGSGGPGCWRLAADMKRNGITVEDAPQIVTGDGWFSLTFEEYVNQVDVLPYDHHMLAALVLPRALLVVENSGIDYLGPVSSFGCMTATQMVYDAFGLDDRFGFAQVSHGSSHCQLPGVTGPDVLAFMNKFLLEDESPETDIFKSEGQFNFDAGEWIEWTAPDLG